MFVTLAENRQLLHEQNVEKILVELLSEEDINIKTSACQAVTAMSFLRASIERIRELGMCSPSFNSHYQNHDNGSSTYLCL